MENPGDVGVALGRSREFLMSELARIKADGMPSEEEVDSGAEYPGFRVVSALTDYIDDHEITVAVRAALNRL